MSIVREIPLIVLKTKVVVRKPFMMEYKILKDDHIQNSTRLFKLHGVGEEPWKLGLNAAVAHQGSFSVGGQSRGLSSPTNNRELCTLYKL